MASPSKDSQIIDYKFKNGNLFAPDLPYLYIISLFLDKDDLIAIHNTMVNKHNALTKYLNEELNHIVQLSHPINCECKDKECVCRICKVPMTKVNNLEKKILGHMCMLCAIETVFECSDCGIPLRIWQAQYTYANGSSCHNYYEEDSIATSSYFETSEGKLELRCNGVCNGTNCKRCNKIFSECKCIIKFTVIDEVSSMGDSNPLQDYYEKNEVIVERKSGQVHHREEYHDDYISGESVLSSQDLIKNYNLKNFDYSKAGMIYGDVHMPPLQWCNDPTINLLDP
jgi:hypothetical protein